MWRHVVLSSNPESTEGMRKIMERIGQEKRSSDINMDPNTKDRRAFGSGFKISAS